jgi:thiamine-monophosphate kinase
MRENTLLAELPALFRTGDDSVLVGVGPDDCAHVRSGGGGRVSFSTDMFAEGSHFLPDADPALVARKALGASVSDLAASACRPRWALVGLCLRKGAPEGWAEAFAESLAAAAEHWGVSVIGGDTVSSPFSTVVSTTVAGEPLPGGPVLRGGGRPGDVLVVTGAFGGSILGRHLRPEPRVREIAWLMDFCAGLGGEGFFPTACMDVSDGLALDLSRLCRESGAGAIVEEALVPVSPDAAALSERTGKTPLSHALSDGEDFELLLALPPAAWRALAAADSPFAFTRVGCLTDRAEGLLLQAPDGGRAPLIAEGFEHAW